MIVVGVEIGPIKHAEPAVEFEIAVSCYVSIKSTDNVCAPADTEMTPRCGSAGLKLFSTMATK